MTKTDKKDESEKPVGGFAFFLAIPALLILGVGNFIIVLGSWTVAGTSDVFAFIAAIALGVLVSFLFLRSRISVFIHELKHSILAGLVGNKWKKMEVDDRSGSFEYSYSKYTAHYNAFISLAPYWLPLFTFLGILIGYATCYPDHSLIVVCAGIGYGADLFLGLRDVSPLQTDFSLIRGGYRIGLVYIIAIHLVVMTVCLVWVLHSLHGFLVLGQGWWNIVQGIVELVRGVRRY